MTDPIYDDESFRFRWAPTDFDDVAVVDIDAASATITIIADDGTVTVSDVLTWDATIAAWVYVRAAGLNPGSYVAKLVVVTFGGLSFVEPVEFVVSAIPSTTGGGVEGSVLCELWTTDAQVRACCGTLSDEFDLTDAILFASEVLYRKSGRRWRGICTDIPLQPCAGSQCGCACSGFSGSRWAWWSTHDTTWPYPSVGCGGSRGCGCGGTCHLPAVHVPGPIYAVSEIVIDGVVLDPAAYRVKGKNTIVRLDGGSWPCSNDLTLNPDVGGDVGAWQVTIDRGRPIPRTARKMAALYACQVAKGMCGSEDCQLPARVKEMVRSGVTLAFEDVDVYLEKGLTGVFLVDTWLRDVNPTGAQRRATITRADARY